MHAVPWRHVGLIACLAATTLIAQPEVGPGQNTGGYCGHCRRRPAPCRVYRYPECFDRWQRMLVFSLDPGTHPLPMSVSIQLKPAK